MIRSTHKTIQDYFKPETVPSKREKAFTGKSNSFDSALQRALNSNAPAPQAERTGLGIRDYMNRRYDALSTQVAIPPQKEKTPSGSSQPPSTGASMNNSAATESKKPPVATPSQTISAQVPSQTIRHAIQRAAERYNVPSDLIHSVIRCESNFKPDALSHAGAQGLMQLMPATANDLGVTDPFNIQQNIDGGTRYLRQMLDRFNGDIETALAAYNAGPGTVSRYGGVPPYRETQAYVEKVMRYAARVETRGIV